MSFYKEGGIRNKLDCQLAIENGEKIRVEQSHKAAVDINYIVAKHAGDLELISKNQELITFDMDTVPTNDFKEIQDIMIKATQAFESVPSNIRAQFNHSPAEYMDFIRNPANADKLVEMGLAEATPEPVKEQPVEVIITNPEPVT